MITLYDLEFTLPGNTISPFAMKVRMALNYKNLPHRTVWLKDHELQQRGAELGLPINDMVYPVPRYKVPIIVDSATGISVSDSARIIAYLDSQYPSSFTPPLIPSGTEAAAVALDNEVLNHMLIPLLPAMAPRNAMWMDEKGREIYRPSCEQLIGMTIEAFFVDLSFERGVFDKAEAQYALADRLFEKARLVKAAGGGRGRDAVEGPFLTGTNLTYADLSAGSVLVWVRRLLGDYEEPWDRLKGWNGGRWARLYEALQQYAVVHE